MTTDVQPNVKVKWGLARKMLGALTRLFVRPYEQRQPPSAKVAIAVPLSLRRDLLPDEEISLLHLCHFLGRYDKFLIAPAGTTVERHGFKTIYFPKKFFGSMAANSNLMYRPRYYEAFRDYEYILIYHLDALVFSDDLMEWCDAGWDYIGAPWVPCSDAPWVREPAVGNGGFTLMKVESCLRVLYNRYQHDPLAYWADLLICNRHRLNPVFKFLETLTRLFPRARPLDWALRRESSEVANDLFWAFYAARFLPDFRVAPVKDGLRFAFEAAPRMCFELNRQQLPFGCHAWARYDRAFWEPYLLGGEKRLSPAS
jgi:hypothetical protein